MKYYKSFVGMLAAAFEEAGEVDGDGNKITTLPNDPGMTEQEYTEWMKGVLSNSLDPFFNKDKKEGNEQRN